MSRLFALGLLFLGSARADEPDLFVDWRLTSYDGRTVSVGQTVTFTWSGNHVVYLHPTGDCTESGAVEVGLSSPAYYTFPSGGVFTFACDVGSHCENGQMISFTVAGDDPTSPTPMPTGTITPIGCSFESGWCGWTYDGDYDWSRGNGATPSSSTGPSADHTTGTGYYAFVESSSPYYPNIGPFTLESPEFSFESGLVIQFYYSMYGDYDGMGTLQLDTFDGGSWTTQWSLTGDQGQDWTLATVVVETEISRVRFVGTTGSTYTSDMAIDDITICVDTDNGALDTFNNGCDVYTTSTTSWCGNYDDSDFSAYDMCCNCVMEASPTATPTEEGACLDSTTWRKVNAPTKGCDWVASMKTKKRCTKHGADGTRAYIGCPVACGRCPGGENAWKDVAEAVSAASRSAAATIPVDAHGRAIPMDAHGRAIPMDWMTDDDDDDDDDEEAAATLKNASAAAN